MPCPHIIRERIDVDLPEAQNLCGLVSEALLGQRVYIPAQRCAGCSQKDDGKTHVSAVITSLLTRRIVVDWAQESASCGCSGSRLTVSEALARLKARDAQAAQNALVDAVRIGKMPQATAQQLAMEHFPEE